MATKMMRGLMLLALALIPAATAWGGYSFEANSAVPPVEVLTGEEGDFVLDRPFSQWVRRPHSGREAIIHECSAAKLELVPDWTHPLPVADGFCAAHDPERGELWLASPHGVSFLDLEGFRKLHFGDKRWLPDNEVRSLGLTAEGDAVVETRAGGAVLAREPMTLEAKALYFSRVAQERHNRLGMVTNSPLRTPGDPSTFFLDDDDNDGQWTQMYLAAESFRYAATGDPDARDNARRSFAAMVRLLTIAPIKGFPARSFLPADQCPGNDPEHWRMLDDGQWCWKGNTSVDELVGHYFGFPIYYDLAADEEERLLIERVIGELTDNLIANGLILIDIHGEPTEDGRWDPEFLNSPQGMLGDQGLNSLQALNGLRAAYHITGRDEYLDYYHMLIRDHNYAENALSVKQITERFQVNHDSDEMAFLSFYNLLRYEDDPELRDKYYMEGLRRSWEADLDRRNPEQIIIYGVFAGRDFRLDLGVRTLREIPLDLVSWDVDHSRRRDLRPSARVDRMGHAQVRDLPPYTEVRVMRWSENPFRVRFLGGDGGLEFAPTFWLLPYWMARYHGIIKPPDWKPSE